MSKKYMVLPNVDFNKIRLISIPVDYQEQEAFRKVTGLIARIEEQNSDYSWEDIAIGLEEFGFEPVDFLLGPTIE